MRYIAIVFCLFLAGACFAYNEAVSAISYNPSRSGGYRLLKVANKATLKGGLQITGGEDLNVLSNGIITIVDKFGEGSEEAVPYRTHTIRTVQPNSVEGSTRATNFDSDDVVVLGKIPAGVSLADKEYAYNMNTMFSDPDDHPASVTVYGGSQFEAKHDSFIGSMAGTGINRLTIIAEGNASVSGSDSIVKATDSLQLGQYKVPAPGSVGHYEFELIQNAGPDGRKRNVLVVYP